MAHTLTFESPNCHGYQHSSGLRVIVAPDDAPICYAGYIIGAGSGQDSPRYHGEAHFAEHMLFKGTKMRSARQIIRRVEEVGADFNAYTTKEETFIYSAFPVSHFPRMLQILTDVVLHSNAPTEEVEKEKGVIIEEIHSYQDSPSELIFDEFENILFRGTPVGHHVLGSEASVSRMSSASLLRFYQTYYRPERMVLCIRGRVDEKSLFEFIEKHFPTRGEAISPLNLRREITLRPIPHKSQITHRYDTYQVHRMIGCSAYSLYHEKRHALVLLNNILGGRGMNSRLNLHLREDEGFVYTVESNYTPMTSCGAIAIYFGAAKKHLNIATDAVYDELRRLREETIGETELRKAKRQFIGQIAVQDDLRESEFIEMGKAFLFFNRYNTIEQLAKRIDALTADDLQQVAQEIFRPHRMLTLTYL